MSVGSFEAAPGFDLDFETLQPIAGQDEDGNDLLMGEIFGGLFPPDPSPATCERAAIDANLAALRDLRIVDIPALIEDRPEAKPNCYNQVCPGEAEAARVKNCERAAKLAGIAAAAKGI